MEIGDVQKRLQHKAPAQSKQRRKEIVTRACIVCQKQVCCKSSHSKTNINNLHFYEDEEVIEKDNDSIEH